MRGAVRDSTLARHLFLLGLGIAVSLMMIVMGVIRENSRQPFLISGQLTIHNQQIINAQPSQVGGTTG